MPNLRKVNDNGPPPGSPNEDGPMDAEINAASAAGALVGSIVHVRPAQASHQMRDDLELRNAREVNRRGLQQDYTRPAWRKG